LDPKIIALEDMISKRTQILRDQESTLSEDQKERLYDDIVRAHLKIGELMKKK
jgi:hypothetical protein